MEESASVYRKELYTESARRDRFIRIAERRTSRILNDFRLLGNTSNKTLYLYSEADIEKIFSTLRSRLGEVEGKFKSSKKDTTFRLG